MNSLEYEAMFISEAAKLGLSVDLDPMAAETDTSHMKSTTAIMVTRRPRSPASEPLTEAPLPPQE